MNGEVGIDRRNLGWPAREEGLRVESDHGRVHGYRLAVPLNERTLKLESPNV